MYCRVCDVTEDIQFDDTPTVVSQKLGANSLLQCVATGMPQPQVSWRFRGEKINPGNSIHLTV